MFKNYNFKWSHMDELCFDAEEHYDELHGSSIYKHEIDWWEGGYESEE